MWLENQIQSLEDAANADHKTIGRHDLDDTLSAHANFNIKTYNNGDSTHYDSVDAAIGAKFDSHGLSKGTPAAQALQLDKLLGSGVDKNRAFYTAPFEVDKSIKTAMGAAMGTAGGTAYKHGVAVITGGYGIPIKDGGIVNVFINDAMVNLKAAVEAKYGNRYNVHFLSEQKAVLESQARLHQSTLKPNLQQQKFSISELEQKLGLRQGSLSVEKSNRDQNLVFVRNKITGKSQATQATPESIEVAAKKVFSLI